MVKLSSAGKDALDEFVARLEKENNTPGFAIGVSSADEELYFSTGGYKAFNEPTSGPVTPDSVFWICSMAKLITAIAALQLIEQKRLSFDELITKYIPQFNDAIVLEGLFTPNVTHKPAQAVPTIAHLLTHSSGLSYFAKFPEPIYGQPECYTFEQGPTREASTAEFLELLKCGYPGIPLVNEPGAAFAYGFSSDVLGIIIEQITGISLIDYTEQNIFKPLGIKTTFKLTAELGAKLQELAFRNTDGSISRWENQTAITPRYPQEVHFALGGVGAYSTVPDYLAMLRHLLSIEAGREVSNPILKQETVKGLFQPQLRPEVCGSLDALIRMLDPTGPSYKTEGLNWSTGLAISTKDWPAKRKANSAFWSGWAGTHFLMDPTTGIALVSATQIIPTMDKSAVELFSVLEDIVYANLEE